MKRIAFSYMRFSSPEQARGDSLRRQMQKAEEYAAQQGWDLNRDLRDEGVSAYSGANLKGAFGGFLREIESGNVPRGSILIVESLDRLSRAHPLDAQAQFHVLLKAGIEIVTLTDRRHYTWESVAKEPTLLLGSIMVMMRAHEESAVKSQRIRESWANKRARMTEHRDSPLTAVSPKWLKWNAEAKKWDLVPDRVAVLRRIYNMTAEEGLGMATIAKILNREGVPTFTGRTLIEGVTPGWQPATVGQLLQRRSVLGEFQPRISVAPGKFKPDTSVPVIRDYFPQVISFDLFNRVQAVRLQNDKTGSGRKDTRHGNIFRGKVFCAECGSVARSRYGKPLKSGDQYNYYVCAGAQRSAGECTNKTHIDIDVIEQAVFQGLRARLQLVKSKRTNGAEVEKIAEQLAALGEEHGRKLRRFDTLSEMLDEEESESIRKAYRELSRELDGWDARRAELEKRLSVAQGSGTIGEMIAEADAIIAEARSTDREVRLQARNRLMVFMASIIGRIDIYPDRTAHVVLADNSFQFNVVKGQPTELAWKLDGAEEWTVLRADYTHATLTEADGEAGLRRPRAHTGSYKRAANSWPYRRSDAAD
ncbi:hypothetical protein BKE38_08620 [Pseudoroseomonas deserti]|uniref:Recombinase family protein n=1 Tax=Teichococcus deserti TaxID=1817963 RepID=A0A1V2H462_9PROT|nr:recombinase family protein [Pseudoroseomonas deserti]ONG55720.1 hypothetical protein BKE38_08620 [Pseudoroseomonas deserti]